MSRELVTEIMEAIAPIVSAKIAAARREVEMDAEQVLEAAKQVAAASLDVERNRYTPGEPAARLSLERKAKILRSALTNRGGGKRRG